MHFRLIVGQDFRDECKGECSSFLFCFLSSASSAPQAAGGHLGCLGVRAGRGQALDESAVHCRVNTVTDRDRERERAVSPSTASFTPVLAGMLDWESNQRPF